MLKAKGAKLKNVKGLLMKDLAKILDVDNKERSQVVDIIHTIKELEKGKGEGKHKCYVSCTGGNAI